MGDILYNVHKTTTRWVVGICDKDVYGKKLQEGNFSLNLDSPFFKGKELNEEEIRTEIEQAQAEDATFNIVGTKAVQIALDMKLINKEGIRTIQEIPIALVLL